MSSKSDKEQMTIEKMRSIYPSITVEGCSSGMKSNTVSSTTTTTTAPSVSSRTLKQSSPVSSTDDKNPDTTHVQVKPAPERRNIPPYTNFQNLGPITKTKKPSLKNPVVAAPASASRKKPEVSSPSESAVQSTSKKPVGKPSLTVTPISNNPKFVDEKPLVTYVACGDNSKSDSPGIQDQLKHFSSEALGKSIQARAITVVNVTKNSPSPTHRILNSPKSAIGSSLTPKPAENTKVVPNSEIFKPIPKPGNVHHPVKSSNRNVLNASYVSKLQGVSGATIINASELPKAILCKTSIADSSVIVTSKQHLPTGNAKSPVEINVSNLPKQTIVQTSSTRTLKPTTAISVANISSASIASQETLHASIKNSPNITRLLSSLSESGDSKELLDAINSGSNVNVTQSVTLSKPAGSTLVIPLVVQQPLSNQKSKIGLLAEIQQKVSVSNSTPISKNCRKNGNVTNDASEEAILSSSSSDVGKYDTSSYLISSDETEINEEISSPKQNQQEEPECLTISSDDEVDEETISEKNGISFSLIPKEAPVAKKNEKMPVETDENLEIDTESLLDVTSGEGYVALTCRTIRIGSFKLLPRSPIVLSKYGLRIVIPGSENLILKIPFREISRVLVHFGNSCPAIFYYVKAETGKKLRNILKPRYQEEIRFNPTSDVAAQRQITLLPENITDADRDAICEIFDNTGGIMRELTHDESNDILLQSAPREIQRSMKQTIVQVPDQVQTIMVFPPPPAKGGISINTEDYACLAADIFLNDVIIDFYLKYLYLNHLSEDDREKTHIFSSFFYKRLTDKATPMPRHLKSAGTNVTPADIRHSRVKNWTKNIDIFSKDYIVIPLNENQHWFLAIICFPGLKGPVRFDDNTPIEVSPKEKKVTIKTEESLVTTDLEKPSSSIGSVTITPIKLTAREKMQICFDDETDLEDRDEAEATDEEVISEEDTDEEYLPEETDEKPKLRQKPEREPIKQPCILIFDSLRGACRNRIIATLRDYLRVEYKIKHGVDRDFSKKIVKGAIPHVPQQDNFTDCGLFVLQYVEAFFDEKITDYHLPINTLRDWFPSEEVAAKRYTIQKLLHTLMEVQGIDRESLNLPNLHLEPSDDEDDDEDGFYGTDEEDCDDDDEDGSPEYGFHPGFYDGEEDEVDEDEMVVAGNRFAFYDSEDEDQEDMDSDEELGADDLYKNLGDYRVESSGKCIEEVEEEEEMNLEEEEEEEEVANEEDEEEQQLSSDIQEKLKKSNLNRETVSIRMTSVNNRIVPPASSGSAGALTSTTTNMIPKPETDLAKLKAARTWREHSNDDCSNPKKFKHN